MAKHYSAWFALICLSFILPDMKIHFCLGDVLNFHVESQISFAPLGCYILGTLRKGSVLCTSQGFNALKQGNSNLFLFGITGAF